MDYIRKQIDRRIDFLKSTGGEVSTRQHLQARLEYVLIYILAYLWNQNIENLDSENKEYIFRKILKPTVGTIVSICRMLDGSKEIFKKSELSRALDKYPSVRNELLGHGFVYEDEPERVSSVLEGLYNSILDSDLPVLRKNVNFVHVQSLSQETFKGISYKSDGLNYEPWSCPKSIHEFEVDSLYGQYDLREGRSLYFRVSPFIEIRSYGRELYFFNSIDEKLLGKVKYNQVLETGVLYKEWAELCELDVLNDGVKVKSHNGTIRNTYKNNYKKYIDIGIKNKLKSFLQNRSSVCATVWGHGGVGKTATIQSLCEDIANDEKKSFDYVIFLSAKDRKYDYYTGKIEEVEARVATFVDVIKGANKIILNEESGDPILITQSSGKKMLLVVDDFETFPKEEKDKIENFISQLNIDQHKVIITTRAANINIGQEYQTNELTKEETKKFLLAVVENENIGSSEVVRKKLEICEFEDKVFAITSGRPLFIFQFAFIIGQKGLVDALNFNIREGSAAISFLFGRIYDYLSHRAKRLFCVLSLLVTQDDLSNVIEKAQYILNLEHTADVFSLAVNELVKLKIIKVDDENRFFEIYSREILQIMSDHFESLPRSVKGNYISRRNQVNRDKNKDVEHSLLLNANANRLNKNEIEVIDSYKQIVNRTTSPLDVKLSAILNLAAYLVDRGRKHEALNFLDTYSHYFTTDVNKGRKEKQSYAGFTKMWATYYWASGTKEQKSKAIDILLRYASYGFTKEDIDLEISGMLLQYRSIMAIADWQDLKEKRSYDEITSNEFWQVRSKQKQECKEIHDKNGVFLYKNIESKDLDLISSGARQNVISGLYNFLEVLVRLKKVDFAIEICDFVLRNAPQSFHQQFRKKKTWLISIASNDKEKRKGKGKTKINSTPKRVDNSNPPENITNLGKKLLEAMEKSQDKRK